MMERKKIIKALFLFGLDFVIFGVIWVGIHYLLSKIIKTEEKAIYAVAYFAFGYTWKPFKILGWWGK